MAYQFPLNGGRINASIGGNSISAGAGYSLVSTGTLHLRGGNNITLSQNGQSISIIGNGGGGAALSAGTQSVSTGTVNFANSNGISFGMSGSNQITASHNGITSQTAQTIGGYVTGNTTGQSSFSTFDARSVSMSGLGGVSVGFSGSMYQLSAPAVSSLSATGAVSISRNASTISIGAPAVSMGMSNLGNTSGTSGTVSNQLIFAGGNNITLSQATGAGGNTLSIIGGGGGGIALANSQTLYSSGTVSLLEGSGALTIGTSSNTAGSQILNMSVPAQSSLSATGVVSISTAGNTVYIGAPANIGAAGSIARWEYPNQVFSNVSTIPNGVLSLQHVYIPYNISVRSARIAASLNVSSLTGAGTNASQGMTLSMAIYTLNGSTLSSLASGNTLNSFTYSSAAAGVNNFNGIKELTTPLSINLTPGEYWIGALMSSSSTSGTGFAYTMMGNSLINAGASIGVLGASINVSARDVLMGQGLVTTAAMPSTVALANIVNTAGGAAQRAAFYHALYSTTY